MSKHRTFVIGAWGFYEEQYCNNKIFITPDANIGENLLKPINDLYRYGMAYQIEFVSLDLLGNAQNADAYMFFDFPKLSTRWVHEALSSEKPKFLVINESPIIRPENWKAENHAYFTKIFTYQDDIVDNARYFKINYAFDMPGKVPRNRFESRKLCAMIAGNKMVHHPLSLYPNRIEAIRWFEKHHPEAFDLYGIGWQKEKFPSYLGRVKSKRHTLAKYKYSICYENIKEIPGYITEKIFDCLFSGCVPVYWGAKNVSRHIAKDCFIDKREFESYEDLYRFLINMDARTYDSYLDAIDDFLGSERAAQFSIRKFCETLINECANLENPICIENGSRQNQIGHPVSPTPSQTSPKKSKVKDMTIPEKGLASIHLVAFNKLEMTRQCVESVLKHTHRPYELILVDNGSDPSVSDYFESIKKRHAATIVVRNFSNRIVEDAANHSLSVARGEYIVAISNDNIVHEGWLDNFIRQIESSEDIGMVGCRSNDISGPQKAQSNYQTIEEYHQFAERWCRQHQGTSFEVARMVGMAFIVRKSTLARIGGYDPDLATNGRDGGYGFSDDDISLRMLLAGYRLVVANDVILHHFGSATANQDRPNLFGVCQNLNKVKFIHKLKGNPHVRLGANGELSIIPFQLKDPIPVADHMRIEPVSFKIALVHEQAEGPTISHHHAGSANRTVEVVGVHSRDVMTLLKQEASKKKRSILVLADQRLAPPVDVLEGLMDAALHFPDVAVCVPGGLYAPQTHRQDCEMGSSVEIIPYADMSVCAVNLRCLEGCLETMQFTDCLQDDLFFLQRRIRGDGFHIGRVRGCVLATDKPQASHAYDQYVRPGELLERNDLKRAEAIYKADIRRDPSFKASIFHLGRIYAMQGAVKNAVTQFTRTLELDPDHIDALIELAKLFLGNGLLAQAKSMLQKAFEKQPRNETVIQLIGALEKENQKRTGGHRHGVRDATRSETSVPDRSLKNSTRPTVSLCMIVRDEEQYIGKCLESVQPIVNEMIVVDTGSKDGTKSIAMSYGAKVYDFEWNDDFAAARNYGLQKAGCDWILVMDADETISRIDHSAFRDFLQKIADEDHLAFVMTTRNYTEKHNADNWSGCDGRYPESRGSGWVPTEKVRLFPNNQNIHFTFPVHEIVDPVLEKKGFRFERCPIPVHHFGKLDPQRNRESWQAYYRIGKSKLNELGENSIALRELAIQAALLNHLEESADYWMRYIRLCPDSENAWTNLASLYSRLGRYAKARAAAFEAAKLAPDELEPLYNVAISELQDGNATGAIKASDRLLSEFPDYTQGHVLQAVSLVCAGELKTGIARFKSVRQNVDHQQFMQMIVEIAAPLRHAGHNEWIRIICEAVQAGNGPRWETRGEFQSAKGHFAIAECHSAPTGGQDSFRQSTGAKPGRAERTQILVYYEGLSHPHEPYAGTSAILFELSRKINAGTDKFYVDMMGDGIRTPATSRGVRFLPTPKKDKLQDCLGAYDVVIFASHIRNFRHCVKPTSQLWLLYQHCWEIEPEELEQIHLFDAVIALSHKHKQAMAEQGISPEAIEIFPNAIDTQFFKPVPNVPRKPHSIMFAGAIVPYKRLDVLLGAFNRTLTKYPDATLNVYGSAGLWHAGNEYERELYVLNSPNARFHGAVQNGQMPEIYSKHSILCLPSTLESFSLVCIEAQACGCAVVAHNAGGVSVTVPDAGTGYLYAPNTAFNLANAIEQAFHRLDTDSTIRRRCRQYVCDSFDMDKNLPRFIGILNRRIAQNNSPNPSYAMAQ